MYKKFAEAKAASRKKKPAREMAGGCLSLFGMPFLLAGLALSVFYFSGYLKWWEARSWVEVPCVIDSTELKESRGDDSTTYSVKASYHYDFQGRTHQGERVSFGMGSDNVGNFQRTAYRELSRHQGGGPFRCYVDPENPENSVLYRGLRWEMQAFRAIFTLTFPAGGAGLVAGGIIGGRALKRDEALKQSHPQEPWKWRAAWNGPGIPEQASGVGSSCDLYTLWAALVIFPLIAATAASGAFATDKRAWLLGIFVLIWCLPAWFTLRRFRKRRVMGTALLEMKELPAWPGGRLAGHVLLQRPLPVYGDTELVVTCEKVTTRSTGDGTSTHREQVWQGRESVPRDRVTRDLSGYRLPVDILLPADAPVTGETGDSGEKHEWSLKLRLPASKLAASFEVPVFDTGKSPEPVVRDGMPSVREAAAQDLPERLAARKIRAEFAADGRPVSIHCPPARNLGMLGFLIFFNLIWTGAAVLLVVKDAPLLFRVVWIASAAGIWWAIIYQLIHSRTVSFGDSEIVVANRLGPWTRTARLQKSEITGFSHGSSSSSGNTSFYRVRMEDVYNRKMTLVDNITEATTAEEMTRRIEAWKLAAK